MTAGTIEKETLLALIAIADATDANSCWGSDRAIELLRSHSSPDEMRSAGASEALIGYVFDGGDDGR